MKWNLPAGLKLVKADRSIRIPAREDGVARVVLAAEAPGLHILAAGIDFAGRSLPDWTEALVRVEQ